MYSLEMTQADFSGHAMKKEGVLKTYLTVQYLYKYIINLLSIRFSILVFAIFIYFDREFVFGFPMGNYDMFYPFVN